VTHILFIHGNFGAPSDWGAVTDVIARAVSGVSIDIPNLWTLGVDDPIGELAARVGGARKAGKRVVVVGYSLGARLTLELLARKDTVLDGAVLVSVNPGLTDSATRRDRITSDSKWAEKVSNTAVRWAQILEEWNCQAVFAGSARRDGIAFTSPSEERFVRAAIARRLREWSLGALSPRWSTLETVKCPVLCLAGEHDTKFRLILESIEQLRNPRIACGVVPGAGHRIAHDCPEALGAQVTAFVEQVGL
jgi:pimeloyl-ACP methyl ester carboxylesterase